MVVRFARGVLAFRIRNRGGSLGRSEIVDGGTGKAGRTRTGAAGQTSAALSAGFAGGPCRDHSLRCRLTEGPAASQSGSRAAVGDSAERCCNAGRRTSSDNARASSGSGCAGERRTSRRATPRRTTGCRSTLPAGSHRRRSRCTNGRPSGLRRGLHPLRRSARGSTLPSRSQQANRATQSRAAARSRSSKQPRSAIRPRTRRHRQHRHDG